MLSSLSSKFLKTRFRILYVNFVKVVLKLILTINEPCIHYSYSIFKVRSACRRELHYNTYSRVCQAFFSIFFDRIFRCLLLKCLPSRDRLFDYITSESVCQVLFLIFFKTFFKPLSLTRNRCYFNTSPTICQHLF